MIRELAKELTKEDKQILQVPSSLLRENKYAGSVNENIQKWIKKSNKIISKGYIIYWWNSQLNYR